MDGYDQDLNVAKKRSLSTLEEAGNAEKEVELGSYPLVALDLYLLSFRFLQLPFHTVISCYSIFSHDCVIVIIVANYVALRRGSLLTEKRWPQVIDSPCTHLS